MRISPFLFLLTFFLLGAGCANPAETQVPLTNNQPPTNVPTQNETMNYTFSGVLDSDRIENKIATIETEKGNIVIELFADTAPLTVSNFVNLAEQNYFDGIIFHRREPGFVIQGGDPTGTGAGGPGYTFEDELDDDYTYDRGIVAMANRGPNTNGSQFFIMLDDTNLPKLYSIFGRVISGMEIVDEIAIGDAMTSITISDKE